MKTGTSLIKNDGNIAHPTCVPAKISSKVTLLNTWKKGQNLLEAYWKLWRDDYLLSLRERSQINLKSPRVEVKEIPSKGDIVQIKANVPRRSWKIGKIIELLPNIDGKEKAAKVLLATKSTVNRPLNLLYPIECESIVNDRTEKSEQLSSSNAQSQEKIDKSTKESTLQKPTRLSTRKATVDARDITFGYNLQKELNWIVAMGMLWTFENIRLRELSNLYESVIRQKFALSHYINFLEFLNVYV